MKLLNIKIILIAGLSIFSAGTALGSPIVYDQPPSEKNEIKIFGGNLEGLFEQQGQGVYNKLLDIIFKQSPYTLEISYGPYKRASRDFANQPGSCHFVASKSESFYNTLGGLKLSSLVTSDPINTIYLRVFSPKGKGSINTLEALKGTSVLVDSPAMNSLGLYIDFPEDVTWLTTKSAAQSFELLTSQRGQFIIAYDLDLRVGVGESLANILEWDPSLTLRSLNEVMVCHKTEKNNKFISYFNKRLTELKKNGQLKKLFPMNYID